MSTALGCVDANCLSSSSPSPTTPPDILLASSERSTPKLCLTRQPPDGASLCQDISPPNSSFSPSPTSKNGVGKFDMDEEEELGQDFDVNDDHIAQRNGHASSSDCSQSNQSPVSVNSNTKSSRDSNWLGMSKSNWFPPSPPSPLYRQAPTSGHGPRYYKHCKPGQESFDLPSPTSPTTSAMTSNGAASDSDRFPSPPLPLPPSPPLPSPPDDCRLIDPPGQVDKEQQKSGHVVSQDDITDRQNVSNSSRSSSVNIIGDSPFTSIASKLHSFNHQQSTPSGSEPSSSGVSSTDSCTKQLLMDEVESLPHPPITSSTSNSPNKLASSSSDGRTVVPWSVTDRFLPSSSSSNGPLTSSISFPANTPQWIPPEKSANIEPSLEHHRPVKAIRPTTLWPSDQEVMAKSLIVKPSPSRIAYNSQTVGVTSPSRNPQVFPAKLHRRRHEARSPLPEWSGLSRASVSTSSALTSPRHFGGDRDETGLPIQHRTPSERELVVHGPLSPGATGHSRHSGTHRQHFHSASSSFASPNHHHHPLLSPTCRSSCQPQNCCAFPPGMTRSSMRPVLSDVVDSGMSETEPDEFPSSWTTGTSQMITSPNSELDHRFRNHTLHNQGFDCWPIDQCSVMMDQDKHRRRRHQGSSNDHHPMSPTSVSCCPQRHQPDVMSQSVFYPSSCASDQQHPWSSRQHSLPITDDGLLWQRWQQQQPIRRRSRNALTRSQSHRYPIESPAGHMTESYHHQMSADQCYYPRRSVGRSIPAEHWPPSMAHGGGGSTRSTTAGHMLESNVDFFNQLTGITSPSSPESLMPGQSYSSRSSTRHHRQPHWESGQEPVMRRSHRTSSNSTHHQQLGYQSAIFDDIELQRWFHFNLSRAEAEKLLANTQVGSYLVRRSETSKSVYSLSIRRESDYLHMKIGRDPRSGQFILGEYSQPYPSIGAMIHRYSRNRIPIRGAKPVLLRYPVSRESPTSPVVSP